MNFFRVISIRICVLLVLSTFIQCASSQKMKNISSSILINEPYFQEWVSEKDSGFTLYFPVDDTSTTVLKHAYFKHKKIILLKEENKSVYIGHYTYPKKTDLIMSSDRKEEFKNAIPAGIERIPFRLKDNECVIVYTKDKQEGVFKIEELSEKKL